MDPAFEQETEALAQILDQLDYFQVLKLTQGAGPDQIQEAFHSESRVYHPDRYHSLPESTFKRDVGRIYKRVTESYYVLRDDRRRAKYLSDLASPDRDKKLRYTEESEQESKQAAKKAVEEQIGTTVKGRQLYQQAVKDLQAERGESAVRALKLAMTFEPQNERFKAKLREAEKALSKGGPDFRIR
jgi:DnaJ-class molecular chaperone